MTAPTPEHLRELADQIESGIAANVWDRDARAALRAAADQLEAVHDVDRIAAAIKASKDKWYGPSWNEFRNDPPTQADYGTARMIVAALTAGTAPQEGRDE